MRTEHPVALPKIKGDESFDSLIRKLVVYFTDAIESPHDFEELKRVIFSRNLRPLVKHLVHDIHHERIVSALLALRWHFFASEGEDDRGVNETRALACEIVAWRFVPHLTHQEAIEYLCSELPLPSSSGNSTTASGHLHNESHGADERSPLLPNGEESEAYMGNDQPDSTDTEVSDAGESFAATFAGLTALEIAAVAGAKKFLSEKPIQRVVNGIWKGDIVFWDQLSTHSVKQAQLYNRKKTDPFCRLKVPLYLKVFEIVFFAAFLAFYYAVLIPKQSEVISVPEIMLYIWIAAFAYNELGEFWDAGTIFYATDFWSSWDLAIIAIGIAFFVARIIGVAGHNDQATNAAFDILCVEALFLVPRICSLLSLHPYFGMLLPALKEMTKDFIKFLGLVAILYLGFDTTFTFLARGTYSFRDMNWLLVKVFFGSGYLDIVDEVTIPHPHLTA
ncbi:hypothetical protein LTR37_020363 [Vermiconidia calcicola]|uniref:Uncharacterized protein n=1 Tax=Vermiconidia calcicola TaxID=1690605 RepID=A0ACC3MBI9_9PEZI|nr:hypothetical protein LTR37_020363 [Vermiconidia calcicola]